MLTTHIRYVPHNRRMPECSTRTSYVTLQLMTYLSDTSPVYQTTHPWSDSCKVYDL